MPDPTLAELAARVAAIETRLGMGQPPTPPPVPQPKPAPPTGLRATTLPDKRVQLDWDPAAGVDRWDVLDLANLAAPLKDTVTTPRSIRGPLKAGDRRSYAVQAYNGNGASLLSDVLYLPTPPPVTPAPGPVPTVYPAELVGPNWYLTIPLLAATTGWAQEIKYPTLAQYVSKYFELNAAGDGVVFRCWHGGATTSGSKNPRSELRGMGVDGKTKEAWSTTDGRHRMVIEGQVNRLTKVRPHVVIGQIHDALDDVSMWRVEGDKLWLTDGDNPHGYLVDGAFALGKRYSLAYDVSGGVISYVYNDKPVPWTKSIAATGCYFKAGCYLQSNPTSAPGESVTEFAEVVIYSVDVVHS